MYTVTQVASLLEISGMTVYRLIKTGELSAVQFGKSVKISKEALSDFIRRSALPQSDPDIATKGILSDLD